MILLEIYVFIYNNTDKYITTKNVRNIIISWENNYSARR